MGLFYLGWGQRRRCLGQRAETRRPRCHQGLPHQHRRCLQRCRPPHHHSPPTFCPRSHSSRTSPHPHRHKRPCLLTHLRPWNQLPSTSASHHIILEASYHFHPYLHLPTPPYPASPIFISPLRRYPSLPTISTPSPLYRLYSEGAAPLVRVDPARACTHDSTRTYSTSMVG